MVFDTITSTPLKAAISLYHKYGFEECSANYNNPMDDVIYMKRLINNNLSLPKIKMYLRSYKNSDCKTLYISFFFKPHLFKIKCIRIRRYLCIKFHLYVINQWNTAVVVRAV